MNDPAAVRTWCWKALGDTDLSYILPGVVICGEQQQRAVKAEPGSSDGSLCRPCVDCCLLCHSFSSQQKLLFVGGYTPPTSDE